MDGLRCGHTNFTHGYLMNSDVREPPPGCPAYEDSTLAVHHLMFDCAALQHTRVRVSVLINAGITQHL